jgi:mRNA-degrading endonuclease RelE of RelBE toxin-antitoxin system
MRKVIAMERLAEARVVQLKASVPSTTITNRASSSSIREFWKYRVGDYRLICKIEQSGLALWEICFLN